MLPSQKVYKGEMLQSMDAEKEKLLLGTMNCGHSYPDPEK
jgi:hypothetical protein